MGTERKLAKFAQVDNQRLTARYGWQFFKGQHPYFSLTADLERREGNGHWYWSGGGVLHDEIVKRFPELQRLVRWHLCAYPGGPMHYKANARYWYEKAYGVCRWTDKDDATKALGYFMSTVVFGAVPGDQLPWFDDLDRWLDARLPALIARFEEDLAACGLGLPDAADYLK